MEAESNMTGSEQGVNRGGYWQYRGLGGDESNRRQDYGIYDYYGDYGEDLDEEDEAYSRELEPYLCKNHDQRIKHFYCSEHPSIFC